MLASPRPTQLNARDPVPASHRCQRGVVVSCDGAAASAAFDRRARSLDSGRSSEMRTPRRWMVLWAAIALMFIALLPTEGAAGGKIKFITPPGDEYFGDPDIPGGRKFKRWFGIAPVVFAYWLAFQAPFGLSRRAESAYPPPRPASLRTASVPRECEMTEVLEPGRSPPRDPRTGVVEADAVAVAEVRCRLLYLAARVRRAMLLRTSCLARKQ